jgi:DNA-binding transcriptional LysR family regulator
VATSDAPWTKLKRPGLAHLDGLPVVVPAEGFALGRHLRKAWQRAGVSPKVVAQSSQWDFLLSMAESGMGTAVLPQPLLQRLNLPRHLVVRALPARELSWVVAHVWAADRYLGHAARAWLSCCGAQ